MCTRASVNVREALIKSSRISAISSILESYALKERKRIKTIFACERLNRTQRRNAIGCIAQESEYTHTHTHRKKPIFTEPKGKNSYARHHSQGFSPYKGGRGCFEHDMSKSATGCDRIKTQHWIHKSKKQNKNTHFRHISAHDSQFCSL